MRVSEFYKLGLTQGSLDFADVNVDGDVELFLDPHAIRVSHTDFTAECTTIIQDYFHHLLDAVRKRDRSTGISLLIQLKEPNETRLGFSSGKPRGRALGGTSAIDVWNSLISSRAAISGLISDLEDTILLVEGIGPDIISDMVTVIIRRVLADYTQQMCKVYSIPMVDGVAIGPFWDASTSTWDRTTLALPRPNRKLLLVPKYLVRTITDYNVDEYYDDYILPFFKNVEISSNTELVRLVKSSGVKTVSKKDLKDKYGSGKVAAIKYTIEHPEFIAAYRRDKENPPDTVMQVAKVMRRLDVPDADYSTLLQEVLDVVPGNEEAMVYERKIFALLSAVFFPSLKYPERQSRIHDGRKVVDITYTNDASDGFFGWLSRQYRAPYVLVECKNWSSEIDNTAIDQLLGRMADRRGKFGLLVLRTVSNMETLMQRCRDAVNDDRGFIVPLLDSDLTELVRECNETKVNMNYSILRRKFNDLVMDRK